MKNMIIILTTLALLFSCKTFAQDINAIFNNKLTLDSQLSSQTKAMNSLMATYGEVQTKIYKFDGAFEKALENMDPPHNADVGDLTEQSLGNSLSMFILFTESLDLKWMSEDWYEKAREVAKEHANKMGKSLSITINSPEMQNLENLGIGDKIEIRKITLSNPYLDLDNLKVIEGTWISDVLATTIITQEMVESETIGFEDDWEEQEMDMGVGLPEGAHFVKFDDVSETDLLQGDVNYVVEMSTEQAIGFYRNYTGRFINSFEQFETPYLEDGGMMTNFYLLKHEGELKEGDDVISLTIQPAPKSILSDVLGRNQGTWTLLSISRWIEEEY